MVRPEGFEPPTFRSVAGRSNPLSYGRIGPSLPEAGGPEPCPRPSDACVWVRLSKDTDDIRGEFHMYRRLLGAAIAGVLLLGACGGGGGDTDTAQEGAEETPVTEEVPSGEISYFGTEFAFEGPDTIGAGETTFTLDNKGEQPHMLVMVELLDGKTLDDVNTFLQEEGDGGPPPKWVKEVKVEAFAKPGKTASSKPVELTAGNYALLCFVGDKETKKSHAMLGMTKALTVE